MIISSFTSIQRLKACVSDITTSPILFHSGIHKAIIIQISLTDGLFEPNLCKIKHGFNENHLKYINRRKACAIMQNMCMATSN